MADAQLILQLSKNFFKRNNPIEMVFKSIQDQLDYWLNYKSQQKLVKYRYALEQQKFKRIERSLQAGNPVGMMQGSKFNKRY